MVLSPSFLGSPLCSSQALLLWDPSSDFQEGAFFVYYYLSGSRGAHPRLFLDNRGLPCDLFVCSHRPRFSNITRLTGLDPIVTGAGGQLCPMAELTVHYVPRDVALPPISSTPVFTDQQ